MDKTRIKILNSLLLLLFFILVVGIFCKEKKYKKNERFDFQSQIILSDSLSGLWLYDCMLISDSKNIEAVNRENWRKIILSGMTSFKDISTYTEKNTVFPDSISFNWFSFTEETFYQLDVNLPQVKIIKWLNENKLKYVKVNFIFQTNGFVNLIIEDYFDKSRSKNFPLTKKAKIVKDYPWNEITNREEDIILINYNSFTPCFIHVKKKQLLKHIELEANLKLNMLRNYFSNPDENGKMNINSKIDSGIPESVQIEIKDSINDKTKSFFISFDIPRNEICTILQNNPKSEFELHIRMNELDSIQEIYLKNSKQKFILNDLKIKYRLQEYKIF
jgi:hypothetical protein